MANVTTLHNAIISNVSMALFAPMCLNNSKSKSTEIVSFWAVLCWNWSSTYYSFSRGGGGWRHQTLELRSTSEGREVLSGVEDLPLLLLWDLPAPVLDDFMLLSSPLSTSPWCITSRVSRHQQAVVVAAAAAALAITLEIESNLWENRLRLHQFTVVLSDLKKKIIIIHVLHHRTGLIQLSYIMLVWDYFEFNAWSFKRSAM